MWLGQYRRFTIVQERYPRIPNIPPHKTRCPSCLGLLAVDYGCRAEFL